MTERQEVFEESMRLGHSAAWDLQWDRAIEYYRKALSLKPDHPGALTSLGLALLESEQYEEALKVYRHAGKLSPEDAIPVEKVAEILEAMNDHKAAVSQRKAAVELHLKRRDVDKAIDNWTHIARLAPSDLETRSRLAMTFERLGRHRESVYEYLAVASILQRLKKVDRAIEAAQRALRVIPGEKESARTLRMLHQGKELPPPPEPRGATAPLRMEAVKDFVRADSIDDLAVEDSAKADPESVAQTRALTILAGLLFEDDDGEGQDNDHPVDIGDLTTGRISKERESIGHPQMLRYLGQAIDLQTRGNKRQAIAEFERAIQAGLDHPAVHYNLGVILKNMDENEEAIKHLDQALGHPELDLGANLALGRLARMRGDLPEAARFLLQALRRADSLSVDESQSGHLNELYDSILATQSDGDETTLSQIVESTLSFLSGPEWLQRLRQARKQLEGQTKGASLVPIAELLEVGGTERVLQSLARIDDLIANKHLSVALEEAMLALDLVPDYLALHLRMAEVMFLQGHSSGGMNKLRIVAKTHRVRGQIAQAANIYARIIRHSPIDIVARKQLIELLAQQDRVDQAVEQYIDLAELYRQMAEIETARKTLNDAYQLCQRSNVSREVVIRILDRMGDIDLSRLDWREALHNFERICELDPSNEKSRSNLIDLNFRLGQETEAANALDTHLENLVNAGQAQEALTMLEDLAREYPGKQALHSRLAEAYRAAGRIADSIAQYDALGEIQLDAGQRQEAIQTIETIIKLDPPNIEGYHELLHNLRDGK
ncbi:MAG: tetratricopeptide repeat protein [Anaerolineales bacterium]|nr:MAG: tetratricopeptide repeat protein [Anaerolineales bacterium]